MLKGQRHFSQRSKNLYHEAHKQGFMTTEYSTKNGNMSILKMIFDYIQMVIDNYITLVPYVTLVHVRLHCSFFTRYCTRIRPCFCQWQI